MKGAKQVKRKAPTLSHSVCVLLKAEPVNKRGALLLPLLSFQPLQDPLHH